MSNVHRHERRRGHKRAKSTMHVKHYKRRRKLNIQMSDGQASEVKHG